MRKRRRAGLLLAKVAVLSPRSLARLRLAKEQGTRLAVSFDGFSLAISEAAE